MYSLKDEYKRAYGMIRQYYGGKVCESTRQEIGQVLLRNYTPKALNAARKSYFNFIEG